MLVDAFSRIADRIQGLEFKAFWAAIAMWLALSLAVGALAQSKGHSAAYGFLALLLSPLFGMAVVLGLPDRRAAQLVALTVRLGRP